MMQVDTVLHGDALSMLKTLPDNSVDAIVTDPPAGISFMGKDWDNFSGKQATRDSIAAREAVKEDVEKLKLHKGGSSPFGFSPHAGITRAERDAFITFLREVMTEALRVLKPGGHALVWALPRTSHWTATALEDAGFEVRDAIFHHFGSGFPKSAAIDKQIDKMLGKEREVTGQYDSRSAYDGHERISHADICPDNISTTKGYGAVDITAPATPEAAQWAGYGTALKPSTEIWWLVRKPLAESSIAANVLAWGTGGLNIDGCRVSTNGETWKRDNTQGKALMYDGWGMKPNVKEGSTQGRWPSHLLLSHSLWCIPQGVKRVRANKGFEGHMGPVTVNAYGEYTRLPAKHMGDPDGYEQVEAYECHESCPIAELDRQSGVRKSASAGFHGRKPGIPTYGIHDVYNKSITTLQGGMEYGDQGGCSRYFQSFPPDDYIPFGYFSKASRAERNAGCEGLPSQSADYQTKHSKWNIDPRHPDGGYPVAPTPPLQNSHPTVKSLALMRWLIRLITPPGGVVLDMFAGSGSTLVAAIQEGMHFIGIEQDASYVAIAQARIAHAIVSGKTNPARESIPVLDDSVPQEYECSEDCPIRIIGEQSGVSVSSGGGGHHPAGYDTRNGIYGKYGERNLPKNVGKGDTGTAARYFTQFPPDSLFADCDEVAI